MSPLFIILSLLLVVDSIILVAVILLQKKRASGLSGTVAGAGASSGSTYWDQNKGRSMEGMLEKYTKYSAIAFFILTFALGFVR